MENNLCLHFILTGIFLIVHLVQGQNQDGFISLDCGLPPNDSPYTEPNSKLIYTSDAGFIDTGESKRINKQYEKDFFRQFHSLRSFPEGSRNCYSVNITRGRRYLIRASFVYGNYDGQNQLPSFDPYIGPNKWDSVDIQGAGSGIFKEMIHFPTSDALQVCLLKTGTTTPFITTLELRPLNNKTYAPDKGSLQRYFRNYFAKTNAKGLIRYDDDIHDRFWFPFFDDDDWKEINTTFPVNSASDSFDLPDAVMRTAATPKNASAPLVFLWPNPSSPQFLFMHFAEIEILKANETREFNINYNGKLWYGPFSPSNYSANTIYSTSGFNCNEKNCRFELVKTERSTHPPLLNAVEVYIVRN